MEKDLINLGLFVTTGLPFMSKILLENNETYMDHIHEFISKMRELNIFIDIVDKNIIVKNKFDKILLIVDYTSPYLNIIENQKKIIDIEDLKMKIKDI